MKELLIIEDENVHSKVLKEKFEEDGWTVTRAKNGEEGVKMLREKQYDLTLLDLVMPEKNGFDVLKDIKSDPSLKHYKIIVLSNLDRDEDIKMAMELGADEYWVKTQHPVSDLVGMVREFMEKDTNR